MAFRMVTTLTSLASAIATYGMPRQNDTSISFSLGVRSTSSFDFALLRILSKTRLTTSVGRRPSPADGSLGVYRYQFQPMDVYPFDYVARSYEVLAASMPLLDDNLAYYPMPRRALPLYHRERALYDDSRINVVLREDILPDVPFLPLNVGEGYGFLRLMSLEERPDPRDVVIYETIPNEFSRVAGLIATVPQTPLSHVNLRAVQDGVPNAFIRNVLDDGDIDDLIGRYVHYSVTADGYSIRAATPAEVEAYFAASRPPGTQTPERDLTVTQITDLDDIGFDDWNAFGVKAANVAVLRTLGFPDGTVPDGFAVPFYFHRRC